MNLIFLILAFFSDEPYLIDESTTIVLPYSEHVPSVIPPTSPQSELEIAIIPQIDTRCGPTSPHEACQDPGTLSGPTATLPIPITSSLSFLQLQLKMTNQPKTEFLPNPEISTQVNQPDVN